MITHLYHLLSDRYRVLALLTGMLSWNAGMAVDSATGSTDAGVWTQLGVAGLVIVAALYMLRRSDNREGVKDTRAERIEQQLVEHLERQINELRAENDELRSRPAYKRTRSTDQ